MSFLKTHVQVVGALLVREVTTRYGGKPGGYIWAILEPASYVIMMTLVVGGIAHQPALGTSFSEFFATGYLSFFYYAGCVGYLTSAVRANKTLLSYPNVAPIDTILARLIVQTLTTTLVSVLVLGTIIYSQRFPVSIRWGYILESYPLYEQIFGIVSRPLMILSGVMYLPDLVPHPFRDVLLLNPLCHATMLFREGFYPEYRATEFNSTYMWLFVLFVFAVGNMIFTSSRKTLRDD
jgi:capsular polysaccharide transport system permease protein